MRILLSSRSFYPDIGGVETATLLFANGLVERGHEVTVATNTPGDDREFLFRVVRRPSCAALLKLVRDSELVWHNNISLRTFWPLAVVRRPLIVTHQTWLGSNTGAGWLLFKLKQLACMGAQNVFISRALAEVAGLPGLIIPNAYDDKTFGINTDIPRDRDIAFVGRLIRDKGADVLIDALTILAGKNMHVSATVIGEGPELHNLKAQTAAAGLVDRVNFAGPMVGPALAMELNRYRILVVPSRWKEPFGIVALEGAACGCVVIGTSEGGLPEAIGPCGATVPNGDLLGLAECLATVITNPRVLAAYRECIPAHLAKHTAKAIIDAYELIILDMVKGKTRPTTR